MSCSLHIVIAQVTAPQPPCRRVTWCGACYSSDPLIVDIQAAVLQGSIECADVDFCQQLVKHLEAHPVTFRWIPSHRNLSEAGDEEDQEALLQMMKSIDGQTQMLPFCCPCVSQQTPQIASYGRGCAHTG